MLGACPCLLSGFKCADEILSISDEEFQPFMKEEVPARLDADHLIEVAFGLSLSQRDIEKFSLEYEKQNQM